MQENTPVAHSIAVPQEDVKQPTGLVQAMSLDSGDVAPEVTLHQTSSKKSGMGEAFFLLLGAHFTVDCFSSTLAAVQPILMNQLSLTLSQVGLLGGMWMFSSSVLQLPFGLLSDRFPSRYFTVITPLITALVLSCLGLATGFSSLMLMLLLGGMAVAAFHPYSTMEAGRVSGVKRGLGTGVFITAGTAGLAIGPIYLMSVIELVNFERLWFAAVPVIFVSPWLAWRLPDPNPREHKKSNGIDWAVLNSQKWPLLTHYVLVVIRSAVQVGLAQFLAIFLVSVQGMSLKSASIALAIYFSSNSVGAFLGGVACDRFGGRNVVIFSFLASVPFLVAFLALEGWISILLLFVGGVILLCTIPVNVVMSQQLVPSQAGAITALMMGFAWGIAGIIFVPFMGWLADQIGLETVLWGLILLPVLGLPLTWMLPKLTDKAPVQP